MLEPTAISLQVRRWMGENQSSLVSNAIELIRCRPVYTEGLGGIESAQAMVRDMLRELGMDPVVLRGSPELTSHPDFVDASEVVSASSPLEQVLHPQVVGRWDVGRGRTLALNGHIDVEPVDDTAWTKSHWARGAVVDRLLYGRGASDMLAAVAGYTFALSAVRAIGDPAIDVEVHSVSNEELGGNGTLALLEQRALPEWVIIGEPTANAVCESTLGFHHFRVEVYGNSSHMAEVQPGSTSIERLVDVLPALDRVRIGLRARITAAPGFSDYGDNPLSIGMVSAGRVPAVPPPVCVLEGTAYSAPSDSAEDVAELLHRELAHIGAIRLSMRPLSFPGNGACSATGLVEGLQMASTDAGVKTTRRGFSSPSDLRHYARRGSESVVFGPGRLDSAHAPNEHVEIPMLLGFSASIANFILEPGPALRERRQR